MNRSVMSATGLILAVVLFLSLNVFSNNALHTARLDLTEDKLFTLSDGTLNVIRSVPEPIRLKFYFSRTLAKQVPTIDRYGRRVREMLEEFVNASDGKIRLEVVDPEPFTQIEDDAVRAGLQPLPLSNGESLYFGLVGTNTTDEREVVAVFTQDKEQFLEYDLTRLIYNLSDPKKPVVGLITSHQMNAHVTPMMRFGGRGPQPWAIVDVIRESFDLRLVEPTAPKIEDDVDVMMIVHPGQMSAKQRYAIDQFVMRGGRAVIFVDPHSEVAAAGQQPGMPPRGPQTPPKSELESLLNAWGVSVDPEKVVGDFATAQQVNAGYPGKPKVMRYLPWMELGQPQYNRDDVVTSELGPTILVSAGSLTQTANATTELTPLIRSSEQSMLIDANEVRFGPNPQGLIEKFEADDTRHILAGRISGAAHSAFPDGPPKIEGNDLGGKPDPAEHLAQSKTPINVIVVADSDMLFDQLWLRKQNLLGQEVTIPVAANGDFLINALDNLSGSSDLISLRSRGKSARPFEVVEELRRSAEQKFLNQERELQAKLTQSQERIGELQSKAEAGGGQLFSNEQQQEIDKAREEILNTRKELRDVQHNLNKDIERLETELKFVNIGLIPIAVAVLAVILAGLRYQRRRRQASLAQS